MRLARRGFRVMAGVRREADGEALAEAGGDGIVAVRLDVTDERSIRAAVVEVERRLDGGDGGGGLAGLVNNAGIAVGGPLEVMPIDALRRVMEVNVVGLVAVTQAFLALVRRGHRGRPGRIVNMGSASGRLAGPFVGPYSASKFAVEALTDSLRVELRAEGIEVVLIEPGRIATPIWRKSIAASEELVGRVDPEKLERYQAALGRMRVYTGRFLTGGAPADRVAAVVEHALTAARPKTRYVVGVDARLQMFARFIPDRLRDALITRALGLPR